jgi:hypothetical protein
MKAVRSPGVNVFRIVRRHANEIQATDGCKSDTELDLLILGGRQRQIAGSNWVEHVRVAAFLFLLGLPSQRAAGAAYCAAHRNAGGALPSSLR